MARKFRVVVCAYKDTTLVQEVAIGLFDERVEAEKLIENADSNKKAIAAKKVLNQKFPDAIISVQMKFM